MIDVIPLICFDIFIGTDPDTSDSPPMILHPITYSFNSTRSTTEGTLRIEARNMGEAFDKLPHMGYQFVEAKDARGVRVYG